MCPGSRSLVVLFESEQGVSLKYVAGAAKPRHAACPLLLLDMYCISGSDSAIAVEEVFCVKFVFYAKKAVAQSLAGGRPPRKSPTTAAQFRELR